MGECSLVYDPRSAAFAASWEIPGSKRDDKHPAFCPGDVFSRLDCTYAWSMVIQKCMRKRAYLAPSSNIECFSVGTLCFDSNQRHDSGQIYTAGAARPCQGTGVLDGHQGVSFWHFKGIIPLNVYRLRSSCSRQCPFLYAQSLDLCDVAAGDEVLSFTRFFLCWALKMHLRIASLALFKSFQFVKLRKVRTCVAYLPMSRRKSVGPTNQAHASLFATVRTMHGTSAECRCQLI